MNFVIAMLGVLFVGLKLAGIIAWSWWWVTLPFWGGLAIALVAWLVALLIVGGVTLVTTNRVNSQG